METQLHQQLKQRYAQAESDCEQQLGRFRIDVMHGDELLEIQCSTLAAIRDKVRELTPVHQLRIIKPVIRKTRIIRKKWSQVVSQRFSPRHGTWLDLFEELVHFVTVFPRPQLTLEVLLIDVEEVRKPSRGRRRRDRVESRSLLEVVETRQLQTADDLFLLLPAELPIHFDTADLSTALHCPRWLSQKIAYCLRHTGAVTVVGKRGNTWIYQRACQISQRNAG